MGTRRRVAPPAPHSPRYALMRWACWLHQPADHSFLRQGEEHRMMTASAVLIPVADLSAATSRVPVLADTLHHSDNFLVVDPLTTPRHIVPE